MSKMQEQLFDYLRSHAFPQVVFSALLTTKAHSIEWAFVVN
ncbi:hypothetical protein [Thalassotalea sp. PS06]|nr:hypothetical protein [Thalassotalea sp. PS06]